MAFLRIIPSLLLSKKKLVKGIQFENHKVAGWPNSTITAFDSQGADEIQLIDIDTYNLDHNEPDYEVLKKIAENCSTPITFGGGINNMNLALKTIRSGAEKIYINREILKNRNLLTELSKTIGSQAIVVGINIIKIGKEYKIYEKEGEDINLFEYLEKIQSLGAGEIKITLVDREGKKNGLDINICNKINKYLSIPCIFEGGVGSLEDLKIAFLNEIKAVSLGTMLIFSDYNIVKIKKYLFNENFNVRI
tara:strand:- start:1682 stop:2428 length:747 start_codon:yes stop_codon:yes gene_type:complete